MNKEVQFTLLPTGGASPVQLVHEDGRLYPSPYNGDDPGDMIDNLGINQHIYITSDEEIKSINDWVLCPDGKTVTKVVAYDTDIKNYFVFISGAKCFINGDDYKKVIATTNPELTYDSKSSVKYHPSLIPKIDQSGIEYIIKLYNTLNATVGQLASDFAGDRSKGSGHGHPSFTANCLEKGFIEGFKVCLSLTKEQPKRNAITVEYKNICIQTGIPCGMQCIDDCDKVAFKSPKLKDGHICIVK